MRSSLRLIYKRTFRAARTSTCPHAIEKASQSGGSCLKFGGRYCCAPLTTPPVLCASVGGFLAAKKSWSYRLRYITPASSAAFGPNVGRPPCRNTTVTILPYWVFANDPNQPKRVPSFEQVPVFPSTGSSMKL